MCRLALFFTICYVIGGKLEIAFETKELRKLCEYPEEADVAYGVSMANKLRARLADLVAVQNVSEIFTGTPEFIGDILCVHLTDRGRMLFNANHVKCPRTASGEIDWVKVSRVKLTAIEVEND